MDADYSALRRAVLQRRLIKCTYQGLPRELCPFAIGLKQGRAHLLAWQFGGQCTDDLPTDGGWRCIPIYRMFNITICEGDWRVGLTPAPKHICLDQIDVEAGRGSVAA